MCGICGIKKLNHTNRQQLETLLKDALPRIAYRGPDQNGIWVSDCKTTGFGHTRLSIIDLSDNGLQPIQSYCGRYTITFNGEIYNHKYLRKLLKTKYQFNHWSGHSDSETLVNLFSYLSIKEVLKVIQGMFSFALHNSDTGSLILCRDRIGEKPLYWGSFDNEIIFASTPQTIAQMSKRRLSINKHAIHSFLSHSYIGKELSIYNEINKVLPGTYLEIANDLTCEESRYWSAFSYATDLSVKPSIDNLEALLFETVELMLEADVPVGTFLSGGIDSSLVSAIACNIKSDLKTFSIGFTEKEYDEAVFAEKIAKQIKSDHFTKIVTEDDMLGVIPDIPKIWDEPFADSSQIPTYLVSKMASEQVKVVLSGDGGDELFAGYNRYNLGFQMWNKFGRLNPRIKRFLFMGAKSLGPRFMNYVGNSLPGQYKVNFLSDKLSKLERVLLSDDFETYYQKLITVSHQNVLNFYTSEKNKNPAINPEDADLIKLMMLRDQTGYLPDDILVKVDRATMYNHIEARVPFLYPDVVVLANSMTTDLKVRNGKSKFPLRQILYKFVEKKLIERPKMGFGVPIDKWLRGDLMPWATNLLDKDRLHDLNIFNVEKVHELYNEHVSGRRRFHHELWSILMLVQWLNHNNLNGDDII